jgi:hypothetical protein
MMQAKDITTAQFVAAAIEAHEREGVANTSTVSRSLGEDVPYKVVCAKTEKLDKQKIIEGCGCGCGSPIWLRDDDGDIDWSDAARVQRAAKRYGVSPPPMTP